MRGFTPVILIIIAAVVLIAGFFGFQVIKHNKYDNFQIEDVAKSKGKENPFSKMYSAGKCQGEGTITFKFSPMKIEDIGQIEPYGIMVGAHVIPTSHGYISPVEFHSERDKYPVYAPADGYIVNVSHRGQFVGDDAPQGKVTDEYQMYFEHSCTFYSYYDLLTSLSPEIKAEVGELTGFQNKQVRIPIKAGQLVGRIGGQTVDFAVWNFEKEPVYFVNPKSYQGDEDRFYLDDMFAYFEEPLRSQLLSKNMRVAEPRTGKVAYDKEGKLVGNWFREGSGGFNGVQDGPREPGYRYWDGHLSISYDFIDPTQIKFSIGNLEGKAAQLGIVGNSPDPATIGVEQGLIKYELTSNSPTQTAVGYFQGLVLLQLIEPSKLKLELFPDKRSDQVSGFTSKAQMYER